MNYKIEFEISCTTATKKDIEEQLKFLQFPDIDDVVSHPYKVKVTKIEYE